MDIKKMIVVPAVLALAACAGTTAGAQGPDDLGRLHLYEVAPEIAAQAQEAGYIEVSGTGQVAVDANRAWVAFAVETRRLSAAEAAGANAEVMQGVLAAVEEAGFTGAEVETWGYNLRPEYDRMDGSRTMEISAYVASNNVRVTIEDTDDAGRLVDVVIAAGANRIDGVGFSAANTEEAGRAALRAAVANARDEASVIAEALGHELGPALEVRGGAQTPRPFMAAAEARMAMAAPTPIEPGEQVVSATVTIKFALGPARTGR